MALEYFEKACQQGQSYAALELSKLYQEPDLRNYHRAFECAQKAADQGVAEGELVLGNLLFFGRGCQADMNRAYEMYRRAYQHGMFYASVMGVDLGMFYKRRDFSRIVNGRNPIVAHEYLGNSVEGKDVFIADDIISSGESMLDIAYELKKRNAKRIFTYATYALFVNGLDVFDKAVADGVLDGVFGTNLTYRRPELADRPWFHEVDVSKYVAYFIAALNCDVSVSTIVDPHAKIKQLLAEYRGE